MAADSVGAATPRSSRSASPTDVTASARRPRGRGGSRSPSTTTEDVNAAVRKMHDTFFAMKEEMLAQLDHQRHPHQEQLAELADRVSRLELSVAELRPAVSSAGAGSSGGLGRESTEENATVMAPRPSPVLKTKSQTSAKHEDGNASAAVNRSSSVSADLDGRLVTPTMLDCGDMYQVNESVWDVTCFLGHDALGAFNTGVIFCVFVFNLGLQSTFILLVYELLLSEYPISPDKLDGLVKFRLGLAHSVDYADKVTQRSMASQICNFDRKLHLAGDQVALFGDLNDFAEGDWLSKSLVFFVQFLWLCTIQGDIEETATLCNAIWKAKRGRHTRLVFADLRDEGDEDEETASEDSEDSLDQKDPGAELAGFMKVVRIATMTKHRKFFVLLTVCLPKVVLAIILYWVGAKWLAQTTNLSDLILNAVALAFVLEFDEVLYSVLVPRRAKTLVSNLEPVPLRHSDPGTKWSGLYSICMGAITAVVMVLVWYLLLEKVFWEFEQGHTILCSGNLDFVYATNPATKMIHVANTFGEDEYTDTEEIIAQVAGVPIQDHQYWDGFVDSSIFDASVSDFARAVDETAVDAFDQVVSMSGWSMADAAMTLPCQDLASGQSMEASVKTLQMLMDASGIDITISNCSDIPQDYCAYENKTWLRAICPIRCRCEETLLSYTGFFQTPEFGCPSQCETFKAAKNEIDFRHELIKLETGRRLRARIPNEADRKLVQAGWLSEQRRLSGHDVYAPGLQGLPSESNGSDHYDYENDSDYDHAENSEDPTCEDTSDGAFDVDGDNCDSYASNCADYADYASNYDDTDFTALDMCCACGGGGSMVVEYFASSFEGCSDLAVEDFSFAGGCSDSNGEAAQDKNANDCSAYTSYPSMCGFADDDDFTAAEVCCSCGGGYENVSSSLDCYDNFDELCWRLPPKAIRFLLYVRGLFEFSLNNLGFRTTVANVVHMDYAGIAPDADTEAALIEHIAPLQGGSEMGRSLANGSWELVPGLPHPRNFTGCDFLASYEITSLLNIDLCSEGVHSPIRFFCPVACGCDESNGLDECPAACVLTQCSEAPEGCAHVHPWFSSECIAGYHNDGGKPTCYECTGGETRRRRSTNCTSCSDGYYDSGNLDDCIQCLDGATRRRRSTSCTDCDLGTYDAGDADECTSCVGGTTRRRRSTSCTDCPDGSYKSESMTSDECEETLSCFTTRRRAAVCTDCHPGYYNNGSSDDCTRCEGGETRRRAVVGGAVECTACPVGKRDDGDYDDCQDVDCPEHSEGPGVADGCDCDVGYIGTIRPTSTEPYYSGACVKMLVHTSIDGFCHWPITTDTDLCSSAAQELGLTTSEYLSTSTSDEGIYGCTVQSGGSSTPTLNAAGIRPCGYEDDYATCICLGTGQESVCADEEPNTGCPPNASWSTACYGDSAASCCGCKGGGVYTKVYTQYRYELCSDTDGGTISDAQADTDLSGCLKWDWYPWTCQWAVYYDDTDFSPADMCCACGGGYNFTTTVSSTITSTSTTESSTTTYHTTTESSTTLLTVTTASRTTWTATSQEVCVDTDDGAEDPYNDDCDEYNSNPSWCFNYDDSDFTSSDMCCGCGGGVQAVWSLVAADMYCDGYHDVDIKYLGDGMSVPQCQVAIIEDPACGIYMFGRDDECWCTMDGFACDLHTSSYGNSVYMYQQAANEFYQIDAGTCPVPITDAATCLAATTSLGLALSDNEMTTISDSAYPSGCYYHSFGYLYFNTAATGSGATSERVLLCQGTATTTDMLVTGEETTADQVDFGK